MGLDGLVKEVDPRSSESSYPFINRWENRKLSEIIDLVYGSGLSKEVRKPGNYPVYGSNGIVGYHEKALVEGPGIVVGRKGSIGKVIWCNEDFWPIDTTYYVERKNLIDLKWIYYKLISLTLERLNSATGIPGLNRSDAFALNVQVPPFPEQCKIAAILSSVDAAIEKTEAIIDGLKNMQAELLHNLLTRGIDENRRLRDPAVHPEQFKDSPIGTTPINWDVRSIGSVCTLIKDGTHLPPKRVENGPLLLSVRNLIDGQLQLTESDTRVSCEFYKGMHRNWEIRLGDVLLAIVGATIGKTAIVPSMPPFTIQRSVAVLRGRSELLNNNFLRLWLSSAYFQALLWRNVNQTAQPGIYLKGLSSFYIPLPCLDEQKAIVSILTANSSRIQIEETCLNKLKQLKHGLMQDLLTGRVRVKVDGHA